jgi:hypothetical protein
MSIILRAGFATSPRRRLLGRNGVAAGESGGAWAGTNSTVTAEEEAQRRYHPVSKWLKLRRFHLFRTIAHCQPQSGSLTYHHCTLLQSATWLVLFFQNGVYGDIG